jgi:hypothetical protein
VTLPDSFIELIVCADATVLERFFEVLSADSSVVKIAVSLLHFIDYNVSTFFLSLILSPGGKARGMAERRRVLPSDNDGLWFVRLGNRFLGKY